MPHPHDRAGDLGGEARGTDEGAGRAVFVGIPVSEQLHSTIHLMKLRAEDSPTKFRIIDIVYDLFHILSDPSESEIAVAISLQNRTRRVQVLVGSNNGLIAVSFVVPPFQSSPRNHKLRSSQPGASKP